MVFGLAVSIGGAWKDAPINHPRGKTAGYGGEHDPSLGE